MGAEDIGRRAAERVESAARRSEQLAERLVGLATGQQPDAANVREAQALTEEAAEHARQSVERARLGHERAAQAHERTAELHEAAARARVGDSERHRNLAMQHRRAAADDRAAAEQEPAHRIQGTGPSPTRDEDLLSSNGERHDATGSPPTSGNLPATVDELMTQLGDLDIRQEELNVVEEELRGQQEQITQLLDQHEAELRWRRNLAALVPLGLAVTDGTGKLLEVNPALAGAVGVAFSRLRGKPLSVFLAAEDAPAFRTALRALSAPDGSEQRLTITLRPRGGPERRSELFGFTETPGPSPSSTRVQWVLNPLDDAVAERPDDGQPAAVLDGVPLGVAAGDATDVVSLAASFAQLSSLPVTEPDRQRMLSRMATLVRSAVPGADWVSITLGSPLDPQRLGSDSAEAQDFDGRQIHADEGPCWDAHLTGQPVTSEDVTTDARWPRLRATAGEAAVRSVLAIPVREAGEVVGVLNVYSGRPSAFGDANRRIGELAAAAVAGVLQDVAERESLRSLAENLERALTSRAVIDQAKGMLMARLGVDADEAFARLVTLSSRVNVKLRDLARRVVEGDSDVIAAAGG